MSITNNSESCATQKSGILEYVLIKQSTFHIRTSYLGALYVSFGKCWWWRFNPNVVRLLNENNNFWIIYACLFRSPISVVATDGRHASINRCAVFCYLNNAQENELKIAFRKGPRPNKISNVGKYRFLNRAKCIKMPWNSSIMSKLRMKMPKQIKWTNLLAYIRKDRNFGESWKRADWALLQKYDIFKSGQMYLKP